MRRITSDVFGSDGMTGETETPDRIYGTRMFEAPRLSIEN